MRGNRARTKNVTILCNNASTRAYTYVDKRSEEETKFLSVQFNGMRGMFEEEDLGEGEEENGVEAELAGIKD